MGNEGGILANEFSASRVKVLHANISRCGISNVALTHFDGRVFGAALPERFDAILLDAPCSGEGVVRKDPDALKNWSPESNQQIAETQRELIDSAFHALRPGGTLVYSTCTLNREENEEVVQWLLARYPQAVEVLPLGTLFPQATEALTAEGFLHVFPQIFDCEGFFVARLKKTAAIEALPAPGYKVGKFPFRRLKAVKPQRFPPPPPPSDCTGMTVIRSGSVIKRFGCSRKRWNHLSARSVFRGLAFAWRKPITKAFAGSTKRSLRSPRRMPLLN
jgi:16S rRNA (cytosine1407-C5)-methyltransferase